METYYDFNLKRLRKRFSDEKLIHFLAARIAKVHRKNTDPCKDNERFAEVGNKAEETEYQEKRKLGCCGFADHVFTFIDKETGEHRVFWYGFNYGH